MQEACIRGMAKSFATQCTQVFVDPPHLHVGLACPSPLAAHVTSSPCQAGRLFLALLTAWWGTHMAMPHTDGGQECCPPKWPELIGPACLPASLLLPSHPVTQRRQQPPTPGAEAEGQPEQQPVPHTHCATSVTCPHPQQQTVCSPVQLLPAALMQLHL